MKEIRISRRPDGLARVFVGTYEHIIGLHIGDFRQHGERRIRAVHHNNNHGKRPWFTTEKAAIAYIVAAYDDIPSATPVVEWDGKMHDRAIRAGLAKFPFEVA